MISSGNSFLPALWATIQALVLLVISVTVTANSVVRMQTDLGSFDIELFDELLTDPINTVDNFLHYIDDSDYDGTFFHRVATVDTSGVSVLQGGGFIFDGPPGSFFSGGTSSIVDPDDPDEQPILNEPDPVNRPNVSGTIAMAKTSDPDSATSQFFFNIIDNPGLDDPGNAGGFTVFGQVLGDGMDVVEAIAALQRCRDVVIDITPCANFPDTPFVDLSQASNQTLVNINYVGFDFDGDGAIDTLEDAAPNGDGNGDNDPDSTQQHVASFPGGTGEYLVVEAPSDNPLQSINILGETFALANPPATPGFFDEFDFVHGFTGFDLTGLAFGEPVTVTVTLPAGASPNTYYNFGPTVDDETPHWYEFSFDGETGAVFDNNVVTLHFVDGERGDSDLDGVNGIAMTLGGPAVDLDSDDDGILNTVEDGAPNGGDGNGDGTPDREQDYVVSLTDIRGTYVTVETVEPHLPQSIEFFVGSEFDPALDSTNPDTFNPPGIFTGFNFSHGFIAYEVTGVGAAGSATVTITLPEGERPVSYFMFGPTPDENVNHWYEFLYDGETGAEINDNVITLHFVDGMRGDSDLDDTNGIITDPGGPALIAPNSSGAGGGCAVRAAGSGPLQAGAWWAWLVLLVAHRLLTHNNRSARC